MDLYQGKAETCKNFLDFALYVSFFPKLSQGPIVKYKDMEAQLKYRTIAFDKFVSGLEPGSYTHLDVYKRQEKGSSGGQRLDRLHAEKSGECPGVYGEKRKTARVLLGAL